MLLQVGTKRENATVTYTSCPVYRDIADTRIRNMRDHFRCEKLHGHIVVLHACNRRSEIGVIIIIMRVYVHYLRAINNKICNALARPISRQ